MKKLLNGGLALSERSLTIAIVILWVGFIITSVILSAL